MLQPLQRFEWVENRYAGWFEMPRIPGDYRQTVFQCGCRDQEIGAGMAMLVAQNPPAAGNLDINEKNTVAIVQKNGLQPIGKSPSECRIDVSLFADASLHFANGDDAQKQVGSFYLL